uniref:Uncharacterized protein n=1 Tax=Anguilla anguilla TaxID=7936 RepID=A0A0E9RL85_ANGAN
MKMVILVKSMQEPHCSSMTNLIYQHDHHFTILTKPVLYQHSYFHYQLDQAGLTA